MPMTMDEHERLARIDERTSAIKKLLDELAVDLRASRETQARHDEQIKTLQRGGGAGMTNPMTTAGDIITGGTSGTPQRLGVATDGEVLTLVADQAGNWYLVPSTNPNQHSLRIQVIEHK